MAGSSAHAGSGFYVSGKLSATTFDHTINRNTGGFAGLPVPDTSGVTTAETTDFSGGLALGYKHSFGQGQYFIGAEGFYNFENASTRNINGVLVTDIDLDASYGGRVLLGVNATDKLSIYGHGGVTVLDFDVRNSYTFAPPVRTASETEATFSFGVGAGYAVTDRIGVFIEYTQTTDADFDGLPEVAGGTNRVNPNDVSLSAFSIGAKYSF
jgi:opacity protein-like surface antigen